MAAHLIWKTLKNHRRLLPLMFAKYKDSASNLELALVMLFLCTCFYPAGKRPSFYVCFVYILKTKDKRKLCSSLSFPLVTLNQFLLLKAVMWNGGLVFLKAVKVLYSKYYKQDMDLGFDELWKELAITCGFVFLVHCATGFRMNQLRRPHALNSR